MKVAILIFILLWLLSPRCLPAGELITNVDHRLSVNLDGAWQIIVDPFENGFYDYRYHEKADGFFKDRKPAHPGDLIEYNFLNSSVLQVPGDWNSQRERLFFYEGTIWYKKSFRYDLPENKRLFVWFGAANYRADVYLNGVKLGEHEGGFTPFNFEITGLLRPGENVLILKVDNQRHREAVPTVNTDWWNYGGLTRRVMLLELPQTFIRDYFVQLKKGSRNQIGGWVRVAGPHKIQTISITVPDSDIREVVKTDSTGFAAFQIQTKSKKLKLWSPDEPVLHKVTFLSETDTLMDEIGFRTIETSGSKILLNGKPLFLRGISLHEVAPIREGRAFSQEDARTLLGWAKELGCNYIRLAHYPHNEYMVREADKMGILVWSEIPVYWTILWENPATLQNAQAQLSEMITRDKNRASIIIWSVANETPRGDERLHFLKQLIDRARQLDPTRLLTAATELSRHDSTVVIDDPLGEYLDVIGANEYFGWYGGKPHDIPGQRWETIYDKPLIISEFGAGALFGNHGSKEARWTEEYQVFVYRQQIRMLERIPFLAGMSPWILTDFRSPRRPLYGIQDFWNRKGLISNRGERKAAFFVLRKYYQHLLTAEK